jgi:uncharacterized protein
MNDLIQEFLIRLVHFNVPFQRYLYNQIDLSNRLIAIKGARGVGKTTLLLQLAKDKLTKESTIYVSLDHFYFYENSLYELAKEFEKYGGKHLLLDEVHKYPNWSREIKLIYDNLPSLHVILTSSSVVELYRSESDLSRRMVSYVMQELSFREFLFLETGTHFPSAELHDILNNHIELATSILQKMKPLPLFQKYLKYGAYPFYFENEPFYYQKINNIINLTLEVDILAIENLKYETTLKLKKLLKTIASSVPFTPNISRLSELTGLSRNKLVEAIKLLHRAGLIQELNRDISGMGVLTKPEKLYLNNTNLMYALAKDSIQTGNVRETFFQNQLNSMHQVNLSERADFLVNGKITFEVGGKGKTMQQIHGLENAFLVKDDIEIGFGRNIPLWLFGFLY